MLKSLLLIESFWITTTFLLTVEPKFVKEPIDETTLDGNRVKSNVILCDLRLLNETKKPCQNNEFHFSFSVHFGKELRFGRTVKTLAKILSEYSICETKFMKFNNETQALEYFASGDNYLWYEGKKLNETSSPEVSIVKDSDPKKKKLIFKCKLPKSDVFVSIYGDSKSTKSGQTHPLMSNKASVSGLHLRLSFLQMEGLSIKLTQKRNEVYSIIDKTKDWSLNSALEFIPKQSTERFFVYYDSKCRNCRTENHKTKMSSHQLKSINCPLKSATCELNGSCFNEHEIYSPLKYDLESDKPVNNSFVCLSDYSQTSLYMPCAIKNGNCDSNQKCLFNARTFEVRCENL